MIGFNNNGYLTVQTLGSNGFYATSLAVALYVLTRIEYYHIILVGVFLTVAAQYFPSEKVSESKG
jgi:hypothetical protein